MDANNLKDLAQKLAEQRKFITNEETAKMALVVPFIKLLGYDSNTPREVRLEYCADFAQCDGKRLPDRMDYAIFDRTGAKPLMVIETKPLGTDLAAKSQQLARYVAQMADLHFGIITDGCHYMFYGDLESPNQMDRVPFFNFALDDQEADWDKIAKFLTKFSRDSFDADTLVTEAENSRYRQAMITKLAAVLKAPNDDKRFMQWLTTDIYKGSRTATVMARLGEVARDAVEPAFLRALGNEFIDKLKERFHRNLDIARPPDGQSGKDEPKKGAGAKSAPDKGVKPVVTGAVSSEKPPAQAKAHDPRLPPPGTPITKVWRGKNVEVVEQPDGTFTLTADGQTKVMGARSLSGATGAFLLEAGLTGGVNGFHWFGLGKGKDGQ